MANHIVVDLETLGTASDAAILSIGAIVFDTKNLPSISTVWDPGKGAKGSERSRAFYVNVRNSRGSIDLRTVEWWLGAEANSPNSDARAALRTNGLGEARALEAFDTWLRQQGSDIRVWAHATFDQPILASAFTRHDISRWPYRSSRDLRTIFEQSGLHGHEDDLTDEVLVPHHALHDAYQEALALHRAMVSVSWPM